MEKLSPSPIDAYVGTEASEATACGLPGKARAGLRSGTEYTTRRWSGTRFANRRLNGGNAAESETIIIPTMTKRGKWVLVVGGKKYGICEMSGFVLEPLLF